MHNKSQCSPCAIELIALIIKILKSVSLDATHEPIRRLDFLKNLCKKNEHIDEYLMPKNRILHIALKSFNCLESSKSKSSLKEGQRKFHGNKRVPKTRQLIILSGTRDLLWI